MTGNFATRSLATAIKLAVATGLVALLVWGGCGIGPGVEYRPPNVAPSSFVKSSVPNWQRIQLKSGLTVAEAWNRIIDIAPKDSEILPSVYILRTNWRYPIVKQVRMPDSLFPTKDVRHSLSSKQEVRYSYYRVRATFTLSPEDNILRFMVEAQFDETGNRRWIYGYDTDVLMTVAKDLQLAIGE
jgi:hypothetical protein